MKIFTNMKNNVLKWLLKLLSSRAVKTVEDDLKFENIAHVSGVSDYGKIDAVVRTVPYETWFIKTKTCFLFCADNHIIAMANGSFKMAKNIIVGEQVETVNGGELVLVVTNTHIAQHMYSLNVYSDNAYNNLYLTNGIVSKNTATSAAYLLWKAMFFPNTTILICANKLSAAKEVLDRAKYAYEMCPDFLKPGVLVYNKNSIQFDNKSRIICQATTADSGRGLSISLLYCTSGDTMITVYDTETGLEKLISMEELHLELGDYANADEENI